MHLRVWRGGHMKTNRAVKTGFVLVILSAAVSFAQYNPQQNDPQNDRPPDGWRRMGQPEGAGANGGPPHSSRPLPPLPPELGTAPGTYQEVMGAAAARRAAVLITS